jgi:hypothetical protein
VTLCTFFGAECHTHTHLGNTRAGLRGGWGLRGAGRPGWAAGSELDGVGLLGSGLAGGWAGGGYEFGGGAFG